MGVANGPGRRFALGDRFYLRLSGPHETESDRPRRLDSRRALDQIRAALPAIVADTDLDGLIAATSLGGSHVSRPALGRTIPRREGRRHQPACAPMPAPATPRTPERARCRPYPLRR